MPGEFGKPVVVEEELDILIVGGGMASCGAAYEIMRWAEAAKKECGVDLRIKLVDKAALNRLFEEIDDDDTGTETNAFRAPDEGSTGGLTMTRIQIDLPDATAQAARCSRCACP